MKTFNLFKNTKRIILRCICDSIDFVPALQNATKRKTKTEKKKKKKNTNPKIVLSFS